MASARRLYFIAFASAVLCVASLHLCAKTGRLKTAMVDSVVAQAMNEHKIPGLAVGIVGNGGVLYMQGYGTKAVGSGRPVDAGTNFLTCSISKLFTATAIMQLAEAGRIDIKKKLTDYLPDFRMKDERYRDITIEQVLTHTSGLPNVARRHFIRPANDSVALTEFAHALRRKKLAFKPGVQLSSKTYSNTGYNILGLVIERLTGQTFSGYVEQHVLRPVGMDSSSFFYMHISSSRRSSPHKKNWLTGRVQVSGYYPDIPQDKPCGNLNSNVADLCKWMLHNMAIQKGQGSANAVLQQATLHEMWTTQRSIPGFSTSIGLGWWVVESAKYGRYYFHVGNDPGYSAILLIFPGRDLGIVLLCNALYPKDVVWNKLPYAIIGAALQ